MINVECVYKMIFFKCMQYLSTEAKNKHGISIKISLNLNVRSNTLFLEYNVVKDYQQINDFAFTEAYIKLIITNVMNISINILWVTIKQLYSWESNKILSN